MQWEPKAHSKSADHQHETSIETIYENMGFIGDKLDLLYKKL